MGDEKGEQSGRAMRAERARARYDLFKISVKREAEGLGSTTCSGTRCELRSSPP